MQKDEYRYIEYEMYQKTKNTLFQTIVNEDVNPDFNHIAKFIYELTLQSPNHPNFYNNVGDLKQKYHIDFKMDYNTWSYQITYHNNTFLLRLLSPFIHGAKMQRELFSEDRRRKCHERTIALFSQNVKLVTGYVNDLQFPHLKTIHSWLEQTIDHEEYVIDYVMNMVILKRDYDRLMNVDKINELKDPSIIETYQQTFLIPGKLYCLAGDEIAEEIKQKIFTNDIFSKI